MSKHKRIYRIYPDDQSPHTNEEWKQADRYINGMASSGDMHEAVAIAIKAVKNCRFPFVVMEINLPNKPRKPCACWIVYIKRGS